MKWIATALTLLGLALSGHSEQQTNCAPTDQIIIQCGILDSNECSAKRNKQWNLPRLNKVVNLTADAFYNYDDESNGVEITWKSSNSLQLSNTNGFWLKILRHDWSGARTEVQTCLNITHLADSISPAEANNMTFTYRHHRLRKRRETYSVEIIALPRSSRDQDDLASKYFSTVAIPSTTTPATTTTTAPPLWAFSRYINATLDTSKPFSLTSHFRRPSADGTRELLVNHVYYLVALFTAAGENVFDLRGEQVTYEDVYRSAAVEYTNVSYQYLQPGNYEFQVRPQINRPPHCTQNCASSTDHSLIVSVPLTIRGYIYSRSPQLFIAENNDVTVTVDIAPEELLIERYEVYLSKTGSLDNRLHQMAPTKRASSEWSKVNVTFYSADVLKRFNYGDDIQAQVVVQALHRLCGQPGRCNVNGSCVPCSKSASSWQQLHAKIVCSDRGLCEADGGAGCISCASLSKSQKNTEADKWWISLICVLFAIVLFTILAVVLYSRRKAISRCWSATPNRLRSDSQPLVEISKRKVCLAYVPCQEYEDIKNIILSILKEVFHCEVITYTGASDSCNDCEFILVLYSRKLLDAYHIMSSMCSNDSNKPEEFLQKERLVNLLIKPRAPQLPPVLMAIYDHVPVKDVNNFLDKTTDVKLARLPADVDVLAKQLTPFQSNSRETEVALADYKPRLDVVLSELARCDSGFDDDRSLITLETVHVMADPHAMSDQVVDRSGNGRQVIDPVARGSGNSRQVMDPVARGSGNSRQVMDPVAHGSGNGRQLMDPVAHGSGNGRQVMDPVAHGSGNGRQVMAPVAHGSGNGRQNTISTTTPQAEEQKYLPRPPGSPDRNKYSAPPPQMNECISLDSYACSNVNFPNVPLTNSDSFIGHRDC